MAVVPLALREPAAGETRPEPKRQSTGPPTSAADRKEPESTRSCSECGPTTRRRAVVVVAQTPSTLSHNSVSSSTTSAAVEPMPSKRQVILSCPAGASAAKPFPEIVSWLMQPIAVLCGATCVTSMTLIVLPSKRWNGAGGCDPPLSWKLKA
eukprot:scaffold35107_cov28-Tisochrysis_lutea.AAC.10